MPKKAQQLTEEEIALCRKAFNSFDKDGSGTIDVKELKASFASMGQEPTDEEIFMLVQDVDQDGSGEIDFGEYCALIARHKAASAARQGAEADMVGAFVACGGNPDKTGKVSAERLRATIQRFGLMLDVDRLVREADRDYSGQLDFGEFSALLT